MGDAAHGADRARDDDHGVERIAAAHERDVHAFESVRFHIRRNAQAVGQFVLDDLVRVVAQHEVHFVLRGVDVIEQPLRINDAAGAGDGDDDSQAT